MLDQRGFEGRGGKAQSDGEKAERENEGEQPAPEENHGNRSNRSRKKRRPPGRLVIGGKVKNDAAAERDREPGKEPASANLGGGPGANARRHSQADVGPNAIPAPLCSADRPGSYARPRVGSRAGAHAILRLSIVGHDAPCPSRGLKLSGTLYETRPPWRAARSLLLVERVDSAAAGHFRPGVAQTDGAVEHEPAGLRVPVAVEIALPFELHCVV